MNIYYLILILSTMRYFKFRNISIGLYTLWMLLLNSSPLYSEEIKRIGVLFDGSYPPLQILYNEVKHDLEILNHNRYTLEFPDQSQLNAEFSKEKLAEQGKLLLSQIELDLILAVGPLSSKWFSDQTKLKTNIVGLAVEYPEALGVMITKTSKPINPRWTTSFDPLREARMKELLKQITPLTKIIFLCSSLLCKPTDSSFSAGADASSSALTTRILDYLQGIYEVPIKMIPITPGKAKETVAAITQGPVLLDMLYGFSLTQIQEIMATLAHNQVISISLEGMWGAKNGALAALDTNVSANYSMRIFRLLNNTLPENLPIRDVDSTEWILNRQTARNLNYRLPWELKVEARWIADESSTRHLTFQEVLKLASSVDYDHEIHNLREEQAEHLYDAAQRKFFPKIQSQIIYDQQENKISDSSLVPKPRSETRMTLEVSQSIFDRSQWKAIESTQLFQRMSQLKMDLQRKSRVEEITLAYLDHIQAEEQLRLRRAQLSLTRNHQTMVQNRYNQRQVDKSEIVRMQLEHQSALMELLKAQELLYMTQVNMNQILGLSKETLLDLQTDVMASADPENDPLGLEEYTQSIIGEDKLRQFIADEAVNNSLEIAMLNKEIQLSTAEKDSIQGKFWPNIQANLVGFQQIQDSHRKFNQYEFKPGVVFDENSRYRDNYNVGWNARLQLVLPIFDGGADFSEYLAANTKVRESMVRRNKRMAEIESQARIAINAYIGMRSRLRVAYQQSQLGQENLRFTEDDYVQGSLPLIDLLDRRNHLRSLDIDLLQSRYEMVRSYIHLMRSMGHGDLVMATAKNQAFQAFLEKLNKFMQKNY